MPLPPSVPREHLHTRHIDLRGYRRADGLYDIEARLVESRTFTLNVNGTRLVPPGEPVHDMSVRLVVDEDMTVVDVAACIDAAPHRPCDSAAQTLQGIKGLRITAGWSKAIRERLSGAAGCTHLTQLLSPLATVAFQTLAQARHARPHTLDARGRPHKIDSCFAYASKREVVQRLWPEHYDGPASST